MHPDHTLQFRRYELCQWYPRCNSNNSYCFLTQYLQTLHTEILFAVDSSIDSSDMHPVTAGLCVKVLAEKRSGKVKMN